MLGRVRPARALEDPVKKLFVGNLPFSVTEDEVRGIFAEFGDVAAVTIPTDRDTGKPRGFAFVEMSQDEDAEKAIAAVKDRKSTRLELQSRQYLVCRLLLEKKK